MQLSLDFDAFASADFYQSVPVIPSFPIVSLGIPGILNGGAYARMDADLSAGFQFQASASLSYSYTLPPVNVQFGFDSRDKGTTESSDPIPANMAPGSAGGNTKFNADVQISGMIRVCV